jgi:hypothetical protein
MKNQTNRYRLTAKEEANLLEMRAKAEKSRVLVIGDIHLPFERKDYLHLNVKTTYNFARIHTKSINVIELFLLAI